MKMDIDDLYRLIDDILKHRDSFFFLCGVEMKIMNKFS